MLNFSFAAMVSRWILNYEAVSVSVAFASAVTAKIDNVIASLVDRIMQTGS
jgi:hypothetical protein